MRIRNTVKSYSWAIIIRGCPGCGFTCEWRKLLALLSQSEQQSLLCIWTLLRSVFSQSRFGIVVLTVLMQWSCRSPALVSGFLRAASRFCPPQIFRLHMWLFRVSTRTCEGYRSMGWAAGELPAGRLSTALWGNPESVRGWNGETGRKTQKNWDVSLDSRSPQALHCSRKKRKGTCTRPHRRERPIQTIAWQLGN